MGHARHSYSFPLYAWALSRFVFLFDSVFCLLNLPVAYLKIKIKILEELFFIRPSLKSDINQPLGHTPLHKHMLIVHIEHVHADSKRVIGLDCQEENKRPRNETVKELLKHFI